MAIHEGMAWKIYPSVSIKDECPSQWMDTHPHNERCSYCNTFSIGSQCRPTIYCISKPRSIINIVVLHIYNRSGISELLRTYPVFRACCPPFPILSAGIHIPAALSRHPDKWQDRIPSAWSPDRTHPDTHMPQSVSYTHLDVYKRQT